jgi:hypothetical protein
LLIFFDFFLFFLRLSHLCRLRLTELQKEALHVIKVSTKKKIIFLQFSFFLVKEKTTSITLSVEQKKKAYDYLKSPRFRHGIIIEKFNIPITQ